MRVAIFSDLHDNLTNLEIFLKLISSEKIEKIICCGDLCNFETLNFLDNNIEQELIIIRGNADTYSESDLNSCRNINYLERFSSFDLDNLKIGLCHEPSFIKDLFKLEPKLNFIFYGHTHQAWISMRQQAQLVNPGTLGGVFQKASFTIWDSKTGDLKLKLLHYK